MDILWYTPGSSISTFFCSEKFLLGFTPIPTFNAHSNLKTHIWILTDGYLRWFPREIRSYFLLPKHKVQKCPKSGAITLVWKKTAQKAEISQWAFICVFSRMQSYDDVYAFSSFWTNLVPDSAKNRSNPGQRCRKNLPPKVLTWSVRSALSNLIVPIWVVPGEGIICKTGNG